ncbi:MAG: DUF4147 domain-containing protein [Pseudomonadota bacterium]
MVQSLNANAPDRRAYLKQLFVRAVSRCAPQAVLPDLLPSDAPKGKNLVFGAGKAAAEMAAVANAHLKGPTEGLVVTRYGHTTPHSTGQIEVLEASHPVPDEQSVEGAERMQKMASAASPDDRVIFLFSGGGSALLCAPIDGVSIEQKRAITQSLLHSGAPIDAINRVRKHLSAIKGGQLASQVTAGAQLFTFLISDVVGDEPSDIASGPSVPLAGDPESAISTLEQYIGLPEPAVADALRRATRRPAPEHPVVVAASAATALAALTAELESDGWNVVVLGENVEGDATLVGREHAEIALEYRDEGRAVALVSGGELVVQVGNRSGRGGPNLEYLTSLMLALDGATGIEALACDSDGIDGSEDNAGGYLGADSMIRATAQGLDPRSLLQANDTYTCFEALGDLIVTGPTRTNVNDIRIILIDPAEEMPGRV